MTEITSLRDIPQKNIFRKGDTFVLLASYICYDQFHYPQPETGVYNTNRQMGLYPTVSRGIGASAKVYVSQCYSLLQITSHFGQRAVRALWPVPR